MQGVYVMAILAIFMSYPAVFHLQDSVIGQGGDPWQAMWRFEYKGSGGMQDFIKDFTGSGDARLINMSVWPWMPLHYVFGEPVAYNLVWLIIMALSGYAMALFVKILTRQTSIFAAAPLLAGIAYMFLPYRSAHALGHFGAMQLQWIPFICAAVLIYVRKPTAWKIVLIGALFSVQAWTEHHYALWLGIFGLVAAVVYRKELRYFLPSYEGRRPACRTGRGGVAGDERTPSHSPLSKGEKSRTIFWHTTLLLLILIVGVIVPYIPTIKLAATNNTALELGVQQTIRFSADLFSFITPSPQHPLWGRFFDWFFGQYFTGNNAESVQYLGISILVAILFFHKHIPHKQKRLWIATIIVFGLISLGPVLHVFGKETSIPLPYALLAHLPVFSAIRVVARAGVMVGFATCVLFGWTLATNLPGRQAGTPHPRPLPKRERGTVLAIGLVLLLEFLFVPFPIQSARLSPAYDTLKNIQGSRIIEIPAATNYTAASRALYASALHGKEVVGNIALERGESKDADDLIKSIPGVRQLLYVRTTDLEEKRHEFFGQDLAETLPDAMKYLDTYAVLVHTDSLTEKQHQGISSVLNATAGITKQSFSDADLYTLNPNTISSDGVFLSRGEGWENVGYDPKKNSVFAEVPNKATVIIYNMNTYPVTVTLEYALAPESTGELTAEKIITVNPGKREVTFMHAGEGKSIIQNPKFTAIPLQPTPRLRPAGTPL